LRPYNEEEYHNVCETTLLRYVSPSAITIISTFPCVLNSLYVVENVSPRTFIILFKCFWNILSFYCSAFSFVERHLVILLFLNVPSSAITNIHSACIVRVWMNLGVYYVVSGRYLKGWRPYQLFHHTLLPSNLLMSGRVYHYHHPRNARCNITKLIPRVVSVSMYFGLSGHSQELYITVE
jgi:hypothetical protein